MDVTDDQFLGGALKILQPAKGYRAGVDAVFLAAAVPDRPGNEVRVLDLGAGVGTAGLCTAWRILGARVVLMEREAALIELAEENIRRNGLSPRVMAVAGDIASMRSADLAAAGLAPNSFDHVIANPPYHVNGRGTPAGDDLKAAAHAMDQQGLEIWCRFMARMVRPQGTVTLIHKAEALDEVLAGFARRFGGVTVLPVHARRGEPAIRVLVQGIAGSRAAMSLLPGLVLHGVANAFTDEVAGVLRFGAGLDLGYGRAAKVSD